ncbi:hypothetical protein SAMN05216553_113235 [Lentzea fradiae]|uniref:Excreted virulence factor EspC, type VII ESX diderm n=1 Tax=Lentzea fradiae TaxID=200378 RepID=A0A1G7YDI0_9PSEU|nr:hypothetical protein [Lentzea fradiae]SDG94376.1 hypothetical protein SAMN05216553_113235 [Lentzea fradiae]
MQGKEVDIQLLRDEAENAESARQMLRSARYRLTTVRDLFGGDHWGTSPEGQALKNSLLAVVDHRLAEVDQLVAAAEKIAVGLAETADLEEKTEQEVGDSFRKVMPR